MKTTAIIVLILFISASIFLVVFAMGLSSGSDKNIVSATSSTVSNQESNVSAQTSSTQTTENTIDETTSSLSEGEKSSNIEKIEVYLDGTRENGGIFLGEAQYGLPSSETAALYGEKFANSGYSLKWKNTSYNFTPGSLHNIYIYAFISKYGWDYLKQPVVVPGEKTVSANIKLMIDTPLNGSTIANDENIGGWSVNTAIPDSPGISGIELYADGPKGFGKLLGTATLGAARPDVAEAMGNAAYANCGFNYLLAINLFEPGTDHTIYAYANSVTGETQEQVLDIKTGGQKKEENSIIFTETDFASEISKGEITIKGWAIEKDLFKETIAAKPLEDYSVKKIVFTSLKSGNEDIFIMNIDGSGLTQLTDNPTNDMYPQISPDGKKILYTSDINGTWQIMTMNTDGTEKRQITNGSYRSGYPTMSFDGKFIFYEVYMENNWELFRINGDGSSPVRLTFNPGGDDWHPVAHPFDFKVLFESGSVGSEDIFFMDFDGANKILISDYGIRKRTPCISKDGKYISFAGFEEEISSIYIMNSDGSNVVRLTSNPGFDTHPGISPDNKLIVFDSNFSGNSEIYIMNFDGTGVVKLTDIAGDDWGPVFLYQ
ncbi:MAG: TolB family protein [Candidatus Humimicrobiaceae bacterium]